MSELGDYALRVDEIMDKIIGDIEEPKDEKPMSREEMIDRYFPFPKGKHGRVNGNALDELGLKIQRDYRNLGKKKEHPHLENFVDKYSTDSQNYVIAMECDKESRKLTLLGIGITTLGLCCIFPSLVGAPTEADVSFFNKMGLIGAFGAGIGGGFLSAKAIIKLEAAKAEVLSISADFVKRILDSIERKNDRKESLYRFFADYEGKKKDPSLNFARRFISNVNLDNNSLRVNYTIANGLAYYRDTVEDRNNGLATEDDVEQAYGCMIDCFEKAMNSKGCSPEFGNDIYVRSLINEYHQKHDDELKQEGPKR